MVIELWRVNSGKRKLRIHREFSFDKDDERNAVAGRGAENSRGVRRAT
jgi:hypothetical protein